MQTFWGVVGLGVGIWAAIVFGPAVADILGWPLLLAYAVVFVDAGLIGNLPYTLRESSAGLRMLIEYPRFASYSPPGLFLWFTGFVVLPVAGAAFLLRSLRIV